MQRFRFPTNKPELLAQWISRVPRMNWQPAPTSRLCSDHFEPSAFDRSGQTVRLGDGAIPTIFHLKSKLQQATNKSSTSAKILPEKQELQPCTSAQPIIATRQLQPSTSGPPIIATCQSAEYSFPSSVTCINPGNVATATKMASIIDHGYSKIHKRYHETSQTSLKKSSATKSDHCYFVKESPRLLKRKLSEVEQKLDTQMKRSKMMQQKIRRLKRKISSLNQVVDTLKNKNMVSETGLNVLSATFSGVPLEAQ
jgi:THAP domain